MFKVIKNYEQSEQYFRHFEEILHMIYVRMIFVYKIKTDRKVGQSVQIELQSLGQKLTYHNLL